MDQRRRYALGVMVAVLAVVMPVAAYAAVPSMGDGPTAPYGGALPAPNDPPPTQPPNWPPDRPWPPEPQDTTTTTSTTTTTTSTTTTTTTSTTTTTTTVPVTTSTTTTVPVGTTTTTLPATTTTTVPVTTTTLPGSVTTEPVPTTSTPTTTTTVPVTTTTVPATTTTIPGAAVALPGEPPVGPPVVDPADIRAAARAFAGTGTLALLYESPEPAASSPDSEASPADWSAPMDRLLGPMLPPAMVDAITAPLVLFEVLMSAVVSSSNVLVIPLMLLLLALFSRRLRRELRDFLAGV